MVPGAADIFTFIKFPKDIDSSLRSLLYVYTSLPSDYKDALPLTPSVL
jgi:hypothetical protein